LGRCLAVRPHLRAWRCGNEAGGHWFCHQHRRWPLLSLSGLIGSVILAWGISFTWGLFAPPTKVEREEAAQLDNIAVIVRTVLENQKTHPQQVTQFVDERGFENRYPLALALFYSNGRQTLNYGTQNTGGVSVVTLEPSHIIVTNITQSEICVSDWRLLSKIEPKMERGLALR